MPPLQYCDARQLVGHPGRGVFQGARARRTRASCCPASRSRRRTITPRPYAITEEFTAVYRMHSLIPDEFSFRRHSDDQRGRDPRAERGVRGQGAAALRPDVVRRRALLAGDEPSGRARAPQLSESPAEDPGEATDIFNDLAAIDVLRDRERGVPRYCEFRRHMRMSVPDQLRRADRQRGLAARAAGGLRRCREGRPADRHARRDPAAGLRHLRHRVPHLHPDGRDGGSRATASSPTTSRPTSTRRPGSTGSSGAGMRDVVTAPCAGARPALRRHPQHVLPLGPGGELSQWHAASASPAWSTSPW